MLGNKTDHFEKLIEQKLLNFLSLCLHTFLKQDVDIYVMASAMRRVKKCLLFREKQWYKLYLSVDWI